MLSQVLVTNEKAGFIPDPNNSNNSGGTGTIQGQQLFDIGSIDIAGNGGIIGTLVRTGGVGDISVQAGFGIINSEFVSNSEDRIITIEAGGYGIRSSIFTGQTDVGSIKVIGTGKEIPVTAFSPSVRQSELGDIMNSSTGQPLDTSTDLDLFLAVSKTAPKRKGSTEGGVIADTTITGTGSLGSITAFRMIGHVAASTTTAQVLASEIAATPPMTISFANQVGKIRIKESTTRVRLTTGNLVAFDTGINFVSTIVNVSGVINEMSGGFFSGSTHINATGPDGVIDSLTSAHAMSASINTSVALDSLVVGTDLSSVSVSSSGTIDEIDVKRNILGNTKVRVAKTLGTLIVKHSILGGASVQAQKISKQVIGGQVFGTIVITG